MSAFSLVAVSSCESAHFPVVYFKKSRESHENIPNKVFIQWKPFEMCGSRANVFERDKNHYIETSS